MGKHIFDCTTVYILTPIRHPPYASSRSWASLLAAAPTGSFPSPSNRRVSGATGSSSGAIEPLSRSSLAMHQICTGCSIGNLSPLQYVQGCAAPCRATGRGRCHESDLRSDSWRWIHHERTQSWRPKNPALAGTPVGLSVTAPKLASLATTGRAICAQSASWRVEAHGRWSGTTGTLMFWTIPGQPMMFRYTRFPAYPSESHRLAIAVQRGIR